MNQLSEQKNLHFAELLRETVLRGEKTTTWRIWSGEKLDKSGIRVGDTVNLVVSETNQKFAEAKITNIRTTTFQGLTDADRNGHETYSSDKEMYQTFEKFYKTKVTKETQLVVIKFVLNCKGVKRL